MSPRHPDTWLEKTPIGAVCTAIRDGTHGSHARVAEGIPFLSAKNITDDGKVCWDNSDFRVTPAEYSAIHRTFELHAGDVLLTIVGSIGRRAVHDGSKVTFQRSVAFMRPDQDRLLSRFLFHVVGSVAFQRQLLARSNATAQAGLYLGELHQITVELPPVSEQRLVVEVLDTLDEAIADIEQLIAKLELMKQGLLHDLLTRGIDDGGELRDPDRHPDRFKESTLGRIPKAWSTPTIGSLAVHVGSGLTPRGGSEVYLESGVLFIRSQNVHFDGLRLDDAVFIDDATHRAMSRSEVFANDVLMNITGASIGRCCRVPVGLGPTNVNQHVCAIRLTGASRSDAIFLTAFLASPFGQRQVMVLNAGSNRQGLNYEQLRSFDVVWPEAPERRAIAEALEGVDGRMKAEEHALGKLRLLKRGLIEDLLTGRARVTKLLEGNAA
jgi:type I restriction enzyme S subunit